MPGLACVPKGTCNEWHGREHRDLIQVSATEGSRVVVHSLAQIPGPLDLQQDGPAGPSPAASAPLYYKQA